MSRLTIAQYLKAAEVQRQPTELVAIGETLAQCVSLS